MLFIIIAFNKAHIPLCLSSRRPGLQPGLRKSCEQKMKLVVDIEVTEFGLFCLPPWMPYYCTNGLWNNAVYNNCTYL